MTETSEARARNAIPATYNFHGLFALQVAHRGLNVLMRKELGVFLDEVDSVDLRIEEGRVALPDRMLSADFSFDHSSFVVETPGGRIQPVERLLRAESGNSLELLRWVKFAMKQQIMKREASFVHASAVSRDGIGCLFPAWGHTGKTNVILDFLANGYDYMSDDWSFITAGREILGYPRHLELFGYNFECHPFLIAALPTPRERRRLRRKLAATRLARSFAASNWISRALRRWLLDRSFVSVRVPVSRTISGCRTVLRSPLSKVCLLTTARSAVNAVSDVPAQRLARKVALFSHYERLRHYRSQLAMAYAGFGEVEEDLLSRETDLLARAFEGAKCLEVTLPSVLKSQDVDQVRHLIEEA